MASTDDGRRLTEAHRLAQLRIGVDTSRRMQNLWVLLNAEGRTPSVNEWLDAVTIVLGRQFNLSADTARAYYTSFRLAEIGEAGFAARGVPTMSLDAARVSMVATGPVWLRDSIRRGRTVTEASRAAMIQSAREAMRIALDGGRQQIIQSVDEDRRALGWSRVTDGKPCAFCAMLASRGPVFSERTVRFRAHASCSCTAEPAYSRNQEWPPGAREFRELWNTSTSGQSDQANAFRRAYEGR